MAIRVALGFAQGWLTQRIGDPGARYRARKGATLAACAAGAFTRVLEEIDATHGQVGIAASTLNIEKLAPLEIRMPDEVRVRSLTT
ncbi:MAG: hypothetical protein ACT4QD_09920 [Acidobacteriota bacterium]